MLIDRKIVKHIAHLACLDVEDNQDSADVREDLNKIVSMVTQISSLDTDSIEPMLHPLEYIMYEREDLVTEVINRDLFQKIAPAVEQGLYIVPQVVETK